MGRLFCALAALMLAGCTNDPGFTGVAGVREAEPGQVAGCRYVTDIRMAPGVYGPVLAEQGLRYARNKIMADAKEAGADTVVFDKVVPGTDVYELHAVAWRCGA